MLIIGFVVSVIGTLYFTETLKNQAMSNRYGFDIDYMS
jgi:hypothetical protein